MPLVNPTFNKIVTLKKSNHFTIIQKLGLRFPENDDVDADHAWLAPVKSTADIQAIKTLLSKKIIDKKFIYDVLSVDMK